MRVNNNISGKTQLIGRVGGSVPRISIQKKVEKRIRKIGKAEVLYCFYYSNINKIKNQLSMREKVGIILPIL